MNETAAAHLDRAKQALHAAGVLLEADDALDSISRSYYAALHAARGALATVGESPRTHKGVNNRFWVRFIKPGRVPEWLGEVLGQAQQMRGDADYDAFTRFDTLAAEDLLNDVSAFVNAIETLIRDLPDDAAKNA